MHIEIELALEIVRAEFAEMGFVPGDNGRKANLPETCEEGEGGKDDGGEEWLPLVDRVCDALCLEGWISSSSPSVEHDM